MFELRTAVHSDHASIAALHAKSWQQTYRGIMSDHFLDEEVENELIRMWHNRLHSPAANQVITLAVHNDTIIGFACFYLDDNATYGTLLDNLHISTDYQKLGIGKSLIRHCAKVVLAKGSSHKLYLWVFDANRRAKQVYEHLGGRNVETVTKQNMDGTEANGCRYVWDDVKLII